MTEVALEIAGGDLSQRPLPVKRRDEVGQMAWAFGRMIEEQRGVVRQIGASQPTC